MHYVIRMTYLALVSHPDELRQIHYVIRMTYSSILCHPDDLTEVGFPSGWVTAMFFMSSGWDTLPFLSHPDEIANFDFPQHAVALQRFRNKPGVKFLIMHIDNGIEKICAWTILMIMGIFGLLLTITSEIQIISHYLSHGDRTILYILMYVLWNYDIEDK